MKKLIVVILAIFIVIAIGISALGMYEYSTSSKQVQPSANLTQDSQGSPLGSQDLSEKITYTPSEETICTDNVCTMTMYSGREFLLENDIWKHMNDAMSWKGYYFPQYIQDDRVDDFEVVDFNSTTIILKPFVKSSVQLNKDIPLKVDNSIVKTVKLSAINIKAPEQYITVDNTLNHNYSFGENSTTIILGASENLCPTSGSITLGTNQSGSYASTCVADNVAWVIKNGTNMRAGANFTYNSTMLNPTKITVFARFYQNATAMNLRVYIYNWTANAWKDLSGSNLNPTTYTNYTYTITSRINDFINSTDKRMLTKIESASSGTTTQNKRGLYIDDPVITLNESNGGNVGDTYVDNFSTSNKALNYGVGTYMYVRTALEVRRIFILWNMSVVPSGSTITNANMSLYWYTTGAASRQYLAYNTSPMNTTGTSYWNQGTLDSVSCGSGVNCNLDHNMTWNNQPSTSILQDNISIGTTGNKWLYWNVTNAAITAFANTTYQRMSIMIRDDLDTPADQQNIFVSKEGSYTNASVRPQLVITYTAGGDTTIPTYNVNGTNNTSPTPLAPVLMYANWSDNALSYWTFSWNATGSLCNSGFVNDTGVAFSGGTWSNVTKVTPPFCSGKHIDFMFYANDTSNNQNVTATIDETEGTTCTYLGSGDWDINCNDRCNITNTNITGNLRVFSTAIGFLNATNINATNMFENYTHSCYVIRQNLGIGD